MPEFDFARAHPTHDHHGYITNIGYIGRNHHGFTQTLSSKQFTTLIDVISEGEIEGSATASKAGITNKSSFAYSNAFLKDVFLDGTQVYQQNAPNNNGAPIDHLLNYKAVVFQARHGTSNQTALPDVTRVETEIPVGITVLKDVPVSRTITNTLVNAIRVTVVCPSFKEIDSTDGTANGTVVDVDIKLIQGNGTTTTEIEDTIHGKSNDAYFRDYLINLPANVVFPVTIRVERDKPDSSSNLLIDAFQFHSYTELIYQTRTYPDVAHTKLRFDSTISQKIPSRMYRIRGIKIKIPHNATVNLVNGSITYSGTFNGTFKAAKEWCSDPAWILYDFLTNTRYGAAISESSIDKFAFYSASVYNNELVDDGNNTNTKEPRFSCNVNLNNSSEAFEVINQLATVMNVMPFYNNGSITISQDRPTDPSYQFTLANVLEGGFSYSGSSQKTRHTVFNVAYFDMVTKTTDFETVKDTDANIAKLGSVVKNITAFACTSRNQARRLGRWYLYNEQNSTETCTFTATAEAGVVVRPGQIIQISDPLRAGVRRGGLISAASITGIAVDDDANTNLSTSNTPELSVIMSDGTLETRPVQSISGKAITVFPAFSQIPQVNSVWILQNTTIKPTLWRIASVKEDGLNYAITALSHNPSKYDFIEDGTPLEQRNISILHLIPPAPVGLAAEEEIAVINNKAVSRLIVTWQPVKNVQQYRVIYRYNNGNPIDQDVLSNDFIINNSKIGTYEIKVHSFNAIGEISVESTTLTFNAVGKTGVPSDPTNLSIEPVNDMFVRLRFDLSPDLDVVHGGEVEIRHTQSINPANNSFANSTKILSVPGNSTEATVSAQSGTYSIKFVDDGGRKSANAAKVIISLPDAQPNQVILTDREDSDTPPFQGDKINTSFNEGYGGLVLSGTVLWDTVTDVNALPNIDFAGPISKTGSYEFRNVTDLGAIFNLTLKRRFLTAGLLVNDLIDSRTEKINSWTDFDGASAEDVNAKLLVATTNIDPAISVAATYEQNDGSGGSGKFITVTKSSHGYSEGDFVVIDFTAGAATDGNYRIDNVPSPNTFVVLSDTSRSISSGTACTYGANFTQFNTFMNAEFRARAFKFRVELSTEDEAQNIVVQELGYEGSIQRRTETINTAIASGTSAKTVTFQSPFYVGTSSLNGSSTAFLPSIGITLEGAVSGDYFKIDSITGTQFVIHVKDVNNNFKNLNFRYIAVGYGKGS